MIISLEATEDLATQLMHVHSVLQLEGDLSFNDAVKVAARDLGLSPGYIKLLVEILVERGEFEFVMHRTELGTNYFHRLQFVGARDLDLDSFDLERNNLSEVAKRLAERTTEMKAELKGAKTAEREVAKQHKELMRTEQKISEAQQRIVELVERRDILRRVLGLPPITQDDTA